MAKKLSASRRRNKENEGQIQVENTHFRYVDQVERWKQEYDQWRNTEKKLAAVSELSYQPVDYDALLVRVLWQEPEIPNYDYLLDDVKMAVEKKYFLPIAIRIGLLALLFIILLIGIIGLSATIVLITGTAGGAIGVSLYFVKMEKQDELIKSLNDTQAEIERRYTEAKMLADEARKQHETSENERISAVERLMQGELPAIVLRLDTVLPKLGLPFPVEVTIDLFCNVPLIKVWLPSKTVIPSQTCELIPSGRLKYEDKDLRNINKQYLELCAAVMLQIMSETYANIPVFDRGYICGMSREGGTYSDCLINIALDRNTLIEVCKSTNGLAAIQAANAQFEYDTNLSLKAIEEIKPPEWGDIEPHAVRSIHLKIFK